MAPKLSLINSPQGTDGTRPLLEGGWKQESQCLRLDRQSRDGKGECPTPQGLISMAILPPAQLLEGKAGAPGAGQAPEVFPHHSHLALAMTLRGQGQYQRQNAVLRNRPGICFPGGPKATEIRDLKTGSPGTVWLCSSQCVLNSSWRPLTRHPSTPTPASGGRENTCFTNSHPFTFPARLP